MKSSLAFLLYLLITVSSQAQQQKDLIIKDINILTMTNSKVLDNLSILIQNGKIAAIGPFNTLFKTKNTTIINGKGKFLMPGLAEMHSHLPIASKIDTLLLENVAAGVTRLRVMNSSTPQLELKARLESHPEIVAPHLYYSNIITREIKYTSTQFDSLMVSIKKNKLNFIKLLSVANEEVFNSLMLAANKYQITVCGHYPTGIPLEKVLQSGYKSIEHLAGYEKITNDNDLEKVVQLTKEKKVFNCPTLDWDIMSKNLQYPDEYKKRIVFEYAPLKYLEQWQKTYNQTIDKEGRETILVAKEKYQPTFAYKQKILKAMSDAGCLLLLGSDPSTDFQMNGFNLHQEMLNWSQAGIDNYSILKAATITPALFFNEEKLWGTIEVGKDADVIILEKNPLVDIKNSSTVEMTIINGKTFKKKTILNRLK